MKVAFVTPRYGAEVVGGAEAGARTIAEHVVSLLGWPVEVFTTTARDSDTWAPHFSAGDTTEGGVTVHRIQARAGRDPQFDDLSATVLADPRRAKRPAEEEWFRRQGPWSPELVDAVAASDADVVAFYPYLYHPTVAGLPRVAERAVMHPAAHDEPPIHLPRFRDVFRAAQGFAFHTHGERRLVERLFSVAGTPSVTMGLGVDLGAGDEAAARAALGIGDRPYLLCVGRVDDGKGTSLLARYLVAYKERRPGPLALVLAGPVVDRPPDHPDVIVAGRIDEATKWGLLRGARVLVSPSPHESFSLALLEGWLGGAPTLVWAGCEATREHVEASGGGLWFARYAEFEAAVDRLTGDDDLHADLARRGRAYVEANYRWPTVVDRYRSLLERVAG